MSNISTYTPKAYIFLKHVPKPRCLPKRICFQQMGMSPIFPRYLQLHIQLQCILFYMFFKYNWYHIACDCVYLALCLGCFSVFLTYDYFHIHIGFCSETTCQIILLHYSQFAPLQPLL